MKYILVITALFAFSHSMYSAISGSAKVKGIIVAYDKDTVTLSQKGKKVKVPRKFIPSHFKIKGGNEVYALFSVDEMVKKLKKEMEKENKQKKSVKESTQKK